MNRKSIKCIDYVNSMCKILESNIVVHVHVHLLHVHPVGACGLTNQQAKKLISSLSVSESHKTCQGKKRNTESTTSMTMTRAVSSPESSCLANCRMLHVSVHCCLIFFTVHPRS